MYDVKECKDIRDSKKTNIEVTEEAGQTKSFVHRIRKRAGCLQWSHNEKGRFGTRYYYGKA